MAAPDKVPTLAPELSELIDAARLEIDRAISLGGLRNDAIRHVFTALAVHLDALHKVMLDGTQTIAAQLDAVQRAQPKITDRHIAQLGDVLVREFRPSVDSALQQMQGRTLATIAAIGLALFVGGAVIGSVATWYMSDYVPQTYVRIVKPQQN